MTNYSAKKNWKNIFDKRLAFWYCNDMKSYDVTGNIIAYECGELDQEQTIELFQHLVNTGMAWQLQGSYGRTAAALIEAGEISR